MEATPAPERRTDNVSLNCVQPCWNKFAIMHSHRMCLQMYFGFFCSFIIGLVMLAVGCVFINVSLHSESAISIMLCIMGIVCGLIMIATSALLGRLFVSRKCTERNSPQHPPDSVCFHQCSVVHTMSHDQLNSPCGGQPDMESPPSYEVATSPHMTQMTIIHAGQDQPVGHIIQVHHATSPYQPLQVMPHPPLYADSIAPIPEYTSGT